MFLTEEVARPIVLALVPLLRPPFLHLFSYSTGDLRRVRAVLSHWRGGEPDGAVILAGFHGQATPDGQRQAQQDAHLWQGTCSDLFIRMVLFKHR